MRWQRGHQSNDVIDRRGQRQPLGVGGMGGLVGLLPLLLRSRFGWVIVLVILGVGAFGGLGGLFGGASDRGVPEGAAAAKSNDEKAQLVGFVLDDAQQTWRDELARQGATYPTAKLVLFTDATSTACGFGRAATGPFYCPADERVYIDLGFYDELERRFGAQGDFAQAYVIAHEIGHHVQNVLGISDRVHQAAATERAGAEGQSVRLELQADCFAGLWANRTRERDLLEAGDVDEALGAAAAIGDDRIQKRSTGRVHPESWTHGSAEQRSRWFRIGFERGSFEGCDTFAVGVL